MSNDLAQIGGGQQHVPAALVEVEQSRAIQEVQASMIIAKRFPRDEIAAQNRIMEACKRPALAEQAVYSYPRGGTKVEGPSIRLAEVLARYWGNLDYGVREISRQNGSSTMEAFAWDKETNVRATRQFEVAHERWTKAKGASRLEDPRDVYEMTANQGSRRMRACIMQIIPGHIVDEAVKSCRKTLAGNGGEPLTDRASRMVQAFGDYGVNQEMIEKRLGHKLSAITEHELVDLRQIYNSLRDEMSTRDQWFDAQAVAAASTKEKADELKERLNQKQKDAAKQAPPTQGAPAPTNENDTSTNATALASGEDMNKLHEMLERKKVGDIYKMDVNTIVGKLQEMDGGDLTADTCKKVMSGLVKNPPVTALIDKALKGNK